VSPSPDLPGEFAALLAPLGASPLDYVPVSPREVAEMAHMLGWLPDRDHLTFLPVAVPAVPQ
jgi:hypothetical protein